MFSFLRMIKGHNLSIVLAIITISFSIICPEFASGQSLQTYRTGIDIGNNPDTGCDFSLGSVSPGTLPGFELEVTVVVDTELSPPQVVSAEIATCNGTGFANPQSLTGSILTFNDGFLGSDSVEVPIPRSFLDAQTTLRLAHHTLSVDGSEDALYTTDGRPLGETPDGNPGGESIIVEIVSVPTLSSLGLWLLVLLLIGIGVMKLPRGLRAPALVLVMVMSGSLITYAAFTHPLAEDKPADATPADMRAEIIGSHAATTVDTLLLRLDIAKIYVPFTSGFFLRPKLVDAYVAVDINSGILSATSPAPLSAYNIFTLEYIESEANYVWRTPLNNQCWSIHQPGAVIYADEPDANNAAKWTVWVVSDSQSGEFAQEYEILIVEDDPNGNFRTLQFDPVTSNLYIKDHGTDIDSLMSSSEARFILGVPQS